jgi:hypothetical protein
MGEIINENILVRKRKEKTRDYLRDLDVNRRIILEWILQKWGGGEGVNWVHLAQDRDQWRGSVKTGFIKGEEFLD